MGLQNRKKKKGKKENMETQRDTCEYSGCWVPGCLGAWVPGCLGDWVPVGLGAWVPGRLDACWPGGLGAWAPVCVGACPGNAILLRSY